MPEPGDGVLDMPLNLEGQGEEDEMAIADSFFEDRMKADRDRHSTNATSFEKIQEMQYVNTQQFRDATAARIVLEAGSGRTRAETNQPANTAAPNPGTNP